MLFHQEDFSKADPNFGIYNAATPEERKAAMERLWGRDFEYLSLPKLPNPPPPPVLEWGAGRSTKRGRST